ncbi:MAG: hypothetical protein JWP53_1507, partial [Conexibacter sp.]|nr:hypothetical protein [Conexibacter sp.]
MSRWMPVGPAGCVATAIAFAFAGCGTSASGPGTGVQAAGAQHDDDALAGLALGDDPLR